MCGPCEEHWAGEACDIHCLYGRLVPAKDGGFMCGACDEGWVGEACDVYCLHGKLVPARYVGYGYMCGACEEGWTGEACHERKYTGRHGDPQTHRHAGKHTDIRIIVYFSKVHAIS